MTEEERQQRQQRLAECRGLVRDSVDGFFVQWLLDEVERLEKERPAELVYKECPVIVGDGTNWTVIHDELAGWWKLMDPQGERAGWYKDASVMAHHLTAALSEQRRLEKLVRELEAAYALAVQKI